jgi:hypothetical protein
MRTPIDTTLDNLARIVQVVKRDRKLRQWFESLSQQAVPERRREIIQMSAKMTAQGEDDGLVSAFRLLADERFFEAACLALKE